MTQHTQRTQNRRAIRDIKVDVRYAPEKFAPVDAIPNGNVRDLVEWARRSPLRAKRVLAREINAPTPRIGVIRPLFEFLKREQRREAERQANTPAAAATMSEAGGAS